MMDETPSSPVPRSVLPMTLSWLAACLVATTAISLAAAHAPPRARLIGLFSIAFGLSVGLTVVGLSQMLEFWASIRLAGTVAGILSFCGLIASTWETWRIEELLHSETARERVTQQLTELLKAQSTDNPSISIDTSALAGFRWHLARRIRQLGHWASPWPEICWGLELVMGTCTSVWIAVRSQKALLNQSTVREFSSPPP